MVDLLQVGVNRIDQLRVSHSDPAQYIELGAEMKFIVAPFFKDSQIHERVSDIKDGASVIGEGLGYVADSQGIL